jgi:hypothetical protein
MIPCSRYTVTYLPTPQLTFADRRSTLMALLHDIVLWWFRSETAAVEAQKWALNAICNLMATQACAVELLSVHNIAAWITKAITNNAAVEVS